MIKVWDFEFNAVSGKELPDYEDREVIQRTFDRNLDLMASLENRGFEGVFFSEHHFLNSLSPVPNLLVAALAARTSKLKLGVMGNVLAFHQPWRLAEELHMLDYITHGRLEIGIASGVPPEFLFANIPLDDVRPMYAEVREFLELSEKSKFVSYKGKYFNFEEMPIMPRPRKESRRRKWVTIYSATSCREAARWGYKVCTGYQSCDTAREAFDAYRAEADTQGLAVSADDVGLRRQVLIARTDAEAAALNAELQQAVKERMADVFRTVEERLAKAGGGPAQSVKDSGVMDADSVKRDNATGPGPKKANPGLFISPEEYVFGSPESVAEQIVEQCRKCGAGNIMGYVNPAMSDEQTALNYVLWEKVIPMLRKADVDASQGRSAKQAAAAP
jgi:alkanesulfonate monooxygenase SsuD/methylene tetrahydromethanopterin reductase-like flavin-dependent oxidoreductase (luciferase family)